MTSCSLVEFHLLSRENYCLRFQSKIVNRASKIFDIEDEVSTFIRNIVEFHRDYTASSFRWEPHNLQNHRSDKFTSHMSESVSNEGYISCIRPQVCELKWFSDCSDWIGDGCMNFLRGEEQNFPQSFHMCTETHSASPPMYMGSKLTTKLHPVSICILMHHSLSTWSQFLR